ncbi:TIGR02302 family protein [Aestuariispira insulae]|uniref:Uncharacterized protein (TIGR02302 family) n=1 Tax=Aestuariispira insulae TaxID=1461337 RepID=A0A3D9H6I3_9PROT|nr:TIGR02302 family protein [Aestuariispira insulae]RED45059.1 uncharacterized protein (TIGR02302 family) [Aestuariispira insulae]
MDYAPVIAVVGRYRFLLVLAVLLFQALSTALWRPFFLTLFLAGWLILLGEMGGAFWLAWIGLVMNAAAILWTMVLGVRRFHPPSSEDVLRHLEETNGLANRPLRGLADHAASTEEPTSRLLWHRHIQKLVATIGRLEFHFPAPLLSNRDPYALRFLALLILFVGFSVTEGPLGSRLGAAFKGGGLNVPAGEMITLDAWVEPPDYTRIPPILLDRDGRKRAQAGEEETGSGSDLAKRQADLVVVPEGSEMVLRVSQSGEVPSFLSPENAGQAFTREAEGQFAFRATLDADGDYRVDVDGDILAQWSVRVLPDQAPSAAFKGPVQITLRDSILVSYLAQDDYGVADLVLRLRQSGRPDGPVEEFPLPAGFGSRSVLDSSHYLDLTPHPWAGLQVLATLVAVDDRGQTGESAVMAILLPQRVFTHPVARVIIEQRRLLAAGEETPSAVGRNLHALAWNAEAYHHDMTVFLTLDVVAARLHHRKVEPQIPSVLSLLWKVALRLEDGEVSLAAQELEAAEKALLEALKDGAEQELIDQLMNQMEQAMSRYLEALAQQMQQEMEENGESIRDVSNAQQLTGQNIQEMMDKIRELLRMGMVDEAQKMLAELREMMQNLRAAPSPFASGEGKEALDMLKDLYNLMEQQQNLLEDTHDQAMGRERQPGEGSSDPGSMSPQEQAARQEQLRRQLQSLGDRIGDMLGDVPPSMGEAGDSMGDASQALGEGRTHRAAKSQGNALNQLQESAKAVQDAIIERFGNGGSSPQVMQGEAEGSGRDPFGRVPNAGNQGNGAGETEIPDAGDIERARQIRDELRRRSGDQDRPPVELDYIERLLKPF